MTQESIGKLGAGIIGFHQLKLLFSVPRRKTPTTADRLPRATLLLSVAVFSYYL